MPHIKSKSKIIAKFKDSQANDKSVAHKQPNPYNFTKNYRKKCVIPAVKKMTKKSINFIVDLGNMGQISRQNNIFA